VGNKCVGLVVLPRDVHPNVLHSDSFTLHPRTADLVDLETSDGLGERVEVPDGNTTIETRGGDGLDLSGRYAERLKRGDAVLMLSVDRLILRTICGTELIAILPSGHVGGTSSGLRAGSGLLIQRHSSSDRSTRNVEQEGSAIVSCSNEGVGAHPDDIHEGQLRSLHDHLVVGSSRALQDRHGTIVRHPSELVSIGGPVVFEAAKESQREPKDGYHEGQPNTHAGVESSLV